MKAAQLVALFLAFYSSSLAAWGDADYTEKHNLIYASVDTKPLKAEPGKVRLAFDQNRDSLAYSVVIRLEGTSTRSKPEELEAFREAIVEIAARLSSRLKDRITPIQAAEIVTSEEEVCVALISTRYDRAAVIPLRFIK